MNAHRQRDDPLPRFDRAAACQKADDAEWAVWQPGARLKIDVAYLGGGFHGWQQQTGLRTVQGELSHMLSRLLGRQVIPIGAGRTDAGVHARGQVCHVSVSSGDEAQRLCRKLHLLAPADLQVISIRPVSGSFNARFSALARRYSYHLLLRRDVFRQHLALYVPYQLDREAMDAAAGQVLGTHDFASFCKKASLKEQGNECVVDLCQFEWLADSAIFHVRANRFLHNMVRILVGTLLEVGRGRRRAGDISGILAARDRRCAGANVAARGLCLEEVLYPARLLDPCWLQPPGSAAGTVNDDLEGDRP
jgi:tRNA pseudouridine38-40 synthase